MEDRPIEHVIVLMLENRSFDHMLGYLDHPCFEALNPNLHYNDAGAIGRVRVSPNASPIIAASPEHHHVNVMAQLGIRQDLHYRWPARLEPDPVGYLLDYSAATTPAQGPVVMRCFDPGEIPVLATLAREFAVFDRWFCSVPGSTLPNRRYLHAGSSRGATDNVQCRTLSRERTVFQMLDEADHDWAIFHQDATQTYMYRYVLKNLDRVYETPTLIDWITSGKGLPTYMFVDPDHGLIGTGNSQHPGDNTGTDRAFRDGERLIATIYQALRSQPETFAKTAFLITYDEHGGFYDREPPPTDVVPPDNIPEPRWGFDFTMLGPRVPAVLVNPRIARETCVRGTYDHASVPELLRQWFAPNAEHVGRRWAAGMEDPTAAFTPEPRTDDLPNLSDYVDPDLRDSAMGWVALKDLPAEAMLDDTDLDELQADLGYIALLADQWVALEAEGIDPDGAALPGIAEEPAIARAQIVAAVRRLHQRSEEARSAR